MGVPETGLEPAESQSAETLLASLRTIAAAERRKHASVFNYWLSICGGAELPSVRDLDPLELTDAGPCSLLLELSAGGEDAEVRHLGEALRADGVVARLSEAPSPSLLSVIAGKLALVAISHQALAFEEDYESAGGRTRCWVTLLPFSTAGARVDFVYGFVTSKTAPAHAEPVGRPVEDAEPVVEPVAACPPEAASGIPGPEPVVAEGAMLEPDSGDGSSAPPAGDESRQPGFSSKVLDALASVQGYFGTNVSVEPRLPEAGFAANLAAGESEPPGPEATQAPDEEHCPAAEAPPEDAPPATLAAAAAARTPQHSPSEQEATLENLLAEVRAKADEARMARLRANAALYEGLSAAYDFALDAEDQPEHYLRLVGEQGIKIQLRAPMMPVVRLAFGGLCDDHMIAQLEAVLLWALENDLPRGTLAERIEEAGGIGPILSGEAKAA